MNSVILKLSIVLLIASLASCSRSKVEADELIGLISNHCKLKISRHDIVMHREVVIRETCKQVTDSLSHLMKKDSESWKLMPDFAQRPMVTFIIYSQEYCVINYTIHGSLVSLFYVNDEFDEFDASEVFNDHRAFHKLGDMVWIAVNPL